jgi:hypothetical protein
MNTTIKKMLVAVSTAASVGLLLGITLGILRGKDTSDKVLAGIIFGILGALIFAALTAYIAVIIICALKDKPFFTALGIIFLLQPAISWLPVVGAIRIAKPTSSWAFRYYDEDKMKIARERFPAKYAAAAKSVKLCERESRLSS